VSVVWTLSGYAIYMACQWAMLIVVARLGSPEKVGQLALGIAISAPVVLFTNLGLRKVQVTDVAGQFSFADYFGLRLLMNLLAMGIVAVTALGARYDAATGAAILAVGLSKAVEATSDVVYGVLQQGERMDLVAGSLVLRGLMCLGGLAVGMAFTHNVALGMLGVSAGWLAVLLLHDLRTAKRILEDLGGGSLRPRWSPRTMARLAWLALPLGIVTPLAALLSSIPAVLIEKLRGAGELGIYTALAYSYSACNRISSAMGEAASARLARYYARGERAAFARVMGGLLLLAGLVGLLGLGVSAAAGRPILGLLYGPAYAERADILIGFMLVAVAGNLDVVLDYSMTAMRRLKIQPLFAGVGVLVSSAMAATLIPSLGMKGAVLTLGTVTILQGAATLGVIAQGWSRFPRVPDSLATREA
jgi:O-antigen/teichoic acid export membrane protein